MMKKWNKLIMLLSLYLVCASYAKKSAKDWSKIDYDAIDESWTEGDEEDELLTEDEVSYLLINSDVIYYVGEFMCSS